MQYTVSSIVRKKLRSSKYGIPVNNRTIKYMPVECSLDSIDSNSNEKYNKYV